MKPLIYINGRVVDPRELEPEDIDVEDAAHVLSQVNRFGGRTPYPYSVAQHGVFTSFLTSRRWAYECLHHDTVEAYGGDIPSPLKTDAHRSIEAEIRALVLAPALGLAVIEPAAVHDADARALAFESQILLGRSDVKLAGMALGQYASLREVAHALRPLHPRRARDMFIERHYELVGVQA